ncbi:type I-D CRISPR-associated protein Cas5/Csc1 [Cyanobacterium aponinum UTEX 3222]|nr:type I-D CRISPR-associated protein Cas5/Csc1 [Cyanobacterium aponinum]WPF87882.1 type I-D CRISPR-associated protein Cas5/Csc1 [Cyanobacterium aponinum AL20115]WRL36946.1 type I-D CRISPR-associated protein Cas5/Csc1 [Cyanobacterium aponinum UTEX 3221]WRL43278.1 type I-D CRISPR-associated protein Cas5/Csc1 [Cyanobacterium aponinum UTEX 3222]
MIIYRLCITLQDPVYFATRELGRFYATENYLHNYALTYALGFAKSDYHDLKHIPHYEQDLKPLNKLGIYLTPAHPIDFAYVTHTYKWADLRYQVRMEQSSINLPTYGRIRELAPESYFETYLLTRKPVKIPQWIRLGKWMSKAEINIQKIPAPKIKNGIFTCTYPLNPLDVMFTNELINYDVINMPPVSLIKNITMRGDYYQISLDENSKPLINIPVNMSYRFE